MLISPVSWANPSSPVLVKPKIHPQGSGAHDSKSPQEQTVDRDANPTKFPLKFFDDLHRIEPDGSLGSGKNFENLFIESPGTVTVNGRVFVVGKLFDGSRPLNDKNYMISLEEFKDIRTEQGWTQQIPTRQLSDEEVEALTPGIDAKAFLAGAIPLKDKGWTVYSNDGVATGTDNLLFKPANSASQKTPGYSIGTLHRRLANGHVEESPAFPKTYAIPSSQLGNLSHSAYSHELPKSFEEFKPRNTADIFATPKGDQLKILDCAEDTPGKMNSRGLCAEGVQVTLSCALGIPNPSGVDAYQMPAFLEKHGFVKIEGITDPNKTPSGCVNVYDSYARPGTYKNRPTSRGNTIPGFAKPKKYESWLPYYGHVEVKTKSGAISDFTQRKTGLEGKSEGIATISSNRYYKLIGVYCRQ